MTRFAERASKGKTDVKEYQKTLKNIQVIASNQTTIYDKVRNYYFFSFAHMSFLPEFTR